MIKTICTLGVFILLAVSCAGMSAGLGFDPTATATTVPSATTAPTRTTEPTATATATPDFAIDMQKFVNFPESYNYLLAHLEEFVEAPAPLTNRSTFDRWWNDEFIPTVGEVTHEREVDVVAGAYSPLDGIGVGPYWDGKMHFKSLPQFFYFKNQGTIYAVPVFNIQTLDYYPDMTNVTMAVILCNTTYWTATDALSRLSDGESPERIIIYTTGIGDYLSIHQFIDAGFVATGDINDPKMEPLFGPGRIRFYDQKP